MDDQRNRPESCPPLGEEYCAVLYDRLQIIYRFEQRIIFFISPIINFWFKSAPTALGAGSWTWPQASKEVSAISLLTGLTGFHAKHTLQNPSFSFLFQNFSGDWTYRFSCKTYTLSITFEIFNITIQDLLPLNPKKFARIQLNIVFGKFVCFQKRRGRVGGPARLHLHWFH